MRIVQVCPTYYPQVGGIGEQVRNTSERLAKKHDMVVLTTDASGTLPTVESINGVEVKRYKSWAPNEAYYFSWKLRECLLKKRVNYDVLHAHGYGAFPALYASQVKNGGRFVFSPHYHGSGHSFFRSLLHVPYKFLGKGIFKKSDRIICVSNFERNLIKSHFKIDEKKFVVIPNGINFEEFIGLGRRNVPKRDSRVVLYVGRLEKYKGVQYLITVLRKLDESTLLEIVGTGPYKKDLIRLAHEQGIEARVRFYENLPREELLQRYADADVFVLLSRHEAYGISVAEALASGIPCIVLKASALQEWVDNKDVFGIDYPIDLDELASIIKTNIGKKIERTDLCTWDMVAEDLERIYEELQ